MVVWLQASVPGSRPVANLQFAIALHATVEAIKCNLQVVARSVDATLV